MRVYLEMLEFGFQRPLETTIELEFTESGVVVLNLATRNAKSKAQYTKFEMRGTAGLKIFFLRTSYVGASLVKTHLGWPGYL